MTKAAASIPNRKLRLSLLPNKKVYLEIRDFYEFAQPNVAVYVAVFAKGSDTNKKKSYKFYIFQRKFIGFLELLIRFERTTCSLRVSCSTG